MPNNRPNILIVDNDPQSSSDAASVLAMCNYEVKSAATENEALGLVSKHPFDCIVILIELPEGGFALSQQIRKLENYTDTPMAFATKEEIDSALAMEVQFYGGLFLFHIPYLDVELLTQLSSMIRIKQLQDELKEKMVELDKLASTDPLTGLYNRRLFFQRLEGEVSRAGRHVSPITLLFIDIDFFKQVNDYYGHQVGDKVIQQLSNIMTRMLRASDVLGRVGGEEFMIMLPDTPKEPGLDVAERIRQKVEATVFQHGDKTIPITISVGVFWTDNPAKMDVDIMVKCADQALYDAKDGGRNKVVFHILETENGTDAEAQANGSAAS